MRLFSAFFATGLLGCVSDPPIGLVDSGIDSTTTDSTTTDGASEAAADVADSGPVDLPIQSGLAFWFKAEPSVVTFTTQDGGTRIVTKWKDSSPKANDLGPPVNVVYSPTYEPDGLGPKKDAVKFAATGLVFKSDPFTNMDQGYTFMFALSASSGDLGYWLAGSVDSAPTFLVGVGPQADAGAWGLTISPGTVAAANLQLGSTHIYSVVGSLGSTLLFVDGMQAGNGTITTVQAMSRPFASVGARFDMSNKIRDESYGFISEIIGYTRALSPGEQTMVHSYLSAKWK